MPRSFEPYRKKFHSHLFLQFLRPLRDIILKAPVLMPRGDRPLKMSFEDQLNMLIFFHLEEHVSARQMLQVLEQDDYARENIAPKGGIKKSSFFEAVNSRGLQPFQLYLNSSAKRLVAFCPTDTPCSASWSPLMAH